MACSKIFFLLSIVTLILLIPPSTNSTSTTPPACERRYCGSSQLPIEFPFQLLTEENNDNSTVENRGRCGYEGFEVSCTEKNQSIISLPEAGEFVIKTISLEYQQVWINDPDNCLAKRFLQKETIDLRYHSPFDWGNSLSNVTFYNCTVSERKQSLLIDPQLIVPCLSHDNRYYSVMVILHGDEDHGSRYSSWCKNIGSAMIPVTNLVGESHQVQRELVYSDIMLQWSQPGCFCRPGQQCGFSSSDPNSYDFTCHSKVESSPDSGHLSNLVSIAWGISISLFLIWILLSVYDTLRCRWQQRMRRSSLLSNTVVGARFDNNRSMIDVEQCPKIQLSEFVELPKSIDNVCSICLTEYEKDDTLRSMPQCKHYFHAHCIDAWFKMNATCPLCRNFPL